jgi:hypothetical protein
MAWKLIRRTDCPNAVRENQVKLSALPDGMYTLEYTGKIITDGKELLPLFRVIDETLETLGESFVNVPASFPEEIKKSAVLLAAEYKVNISDGVIAIIQK